MVILLLLVVQSKPLCVETFMESQPLGRFGLRYMKQTVAFVIIKAFTPKQAVVAAAAAETKRT